MHKSQITNTLQMPKECTKARLPIRFRCRKNAQKPDYQYASDAERMHKSQITKAKRAAKAVRGA
jgi:hypothetical protein